MRLIWIVVLAVWSTLNPAMSADSPKAVYTALSPSEVARLDQQRQFVASLLVDHFPSLHLTRTKADIAILQKIVDAKVIKKDETWKLQSFGVVLGDALASSIDGLAWCEVTDEFGTDPVLRYKQSSLRVGVLTMISKRVEDGENSDVQHIADFLAEFIRDKAGNYQ